MDDRYLARGLAAVALWALCMNNQAQTAGPPIVNDSSKLNKLEVGLNFLTHGEILSGGLPRQVGDEAGVEDRSSFLQGRTRLIVDFERRRKDDPARERPPLLQAHAVIQNNAVWGMNGNSALDLYEGWVKLTAKMGIFAQVGRIALSYDDERIIGPNDFAMAAASHDVLRLGYEGYGHQLHAILAYNQNGSNVYTNTYYEDGAQSYKTMQTLWYHYDVPKFPLGVSLLFMNVGMQAGFLGDKNSPPRTEYQQLIGSYLNFAPKYFTIEGSYYRQMGKFVDEHNQAGKIRAWMASVKATVKPADSFGFELGYDHLSGDDYVPVPYGGQLGLTRHEVDKGFTPLYGSRTKFYGIMDYYYQSAHINGFTPGLQNAFFGAYVKPVSKLECRATYHYLATATKLTDLDCTLGHAVDLMASYDFSKDISLVAGYTQMMGTETMDRLKQGNGSRHARWGWFSLVISPSLFTTKW